MAGIKPSKVLRAKYSQWKKLGEGGFGQVFKVTRFKDGKEFAVKMLTMGNVPEMRERFHQEALLLKTLRHPNIVSIEEFSEDPTTACLYIVMEYCPGGDLQKALDIRRVLKQPMEEQQVLHIFLQILLGLHFCHTRSQERGHILHRDLKPENILISDTKTFKLADFGLAKMMGPHMQEATSMVGTPRYLSPEIRRGEPYDKKLDMYGMGCLLFEISTLTSFPLRSDKILEIIGQTLKAFTPGFRRMQALLLSPDPDLRPSTSDLLALPSIANLVNFAIDIPLRAKLDLQEKTRAMEEQRKQIDVAEQDLQKREKDLRNAEKALRKQREDQETAIKRLLRKSLSPEPELRRRSSTPECV